jgi:hypothetical protein
MSAVLEVGGNILMSGVNALAIPSSALQPQILGNSVLQQIANGTIGVAYSFQIVPAFGVGPYSSFTILSASSDLMSSTVGSQATPANTYSINSSSGLLTATSGNMAGAESDYFLISYVDGTSTTYRQYYTLTVSASSNTLVCATPTNIGYLTQGNVYTAGNPLATLVAYGGISTLTWSITSQTTVASPNNVGATNNAWAINASTGDITGTATHCGTNTLNVSVTDGTNTATQTYNISVYQYVLNAPRPSYNTGSAFFCLNGEVYEPNGTLFRMRSVDNNQTPSNISNANYWKDLALNIVRSETGFGQSYANENTQINGEKTTLFLNQHMVLIPTRFATLTGGTTTSGNTSLTTIGNALVDWIGTFSTYSAIMNKIIVNVTNEWGSFTGSTGVNWQTAYMAVSGNVSNISGTTITLSTVSGTNPFAAAVSLGKAYIAGASGVSDQLISVSAAGGVSGAWTVTMSTSLAGWTSGGVLWGGSVGILRAAGYTCPLMVDAGGGQDHADLTTYGASVFNSDPFKSVVLSFHLYSAGAGDFATQSQLDTNVLAPLNTLRANSATPFFFGEMGPYAVDVGNGGLANGGAQTAIPTPQCIQTCEKYGIGQAGWAPDAGNTGLTDDDTSQKNGYYYTETSANHGYPSIYKRWGKYVTLDPLRGSVALSTGGATSF